MYTQPIKSWGFWSECFELRTVPKSVWTINTVLILFKFFFLTWPWEVSSKHTLFSPQLNAYRGPSSGLWISLFPSPGLSSVNSSCLPLQHSASATQLQEPTRLHLSYSLPAVARNLPCASFGLGLISLLSFFSKTIVFVGWCPVSSILLFHIFCLPPPFSWLFYMGG